MVKRETTLAFHGGINEIGGNKILVSARNWLGHYGLPQYQVHVSGHIMPLQLKSILKEVDAANVFPIHTEKLSCSASSRETLGVQWCSLRREESTGFNPRKSTSMP